MCGLKAAVGCKFVASPRRSGEKLPGLRETVVLRFAA